jgi:peroxiredoxin
MRSWLMEKSSRTTNFLPFILGGLGLIILSVITLIQQSSQGKDFQGYDPYILPPVEIDQPAPELTLSDLQGRKVSLRDYLGEVVMVNNWATWCPPCREEMPEFQVYYDDHKDEGFQIIAVEAGEPAEEVQDFVDQLGLSFVVLLDPDNLSLKTFQNSTLPNSWVIDRKGYLRLAWLGAINGDTLEEYVTPLLKE